MQRLRAEMALTVKQSDGTVMIMYGINDFPHRPADAIV
jgi:hypothetical protein